MSQLLFNLAFLIFAAIGLLWVCHMIVLGWQYFRGDKSEYVQPEQKTTYWLGTEKIPDRKVDK